MPTIKGDSSRQQPGMRQTHSKDEMKKIHTEDRSHDNLRGDFEGDKNRGPASNEKDPKEMRDNSRSRKLDRADREDGREPII